jgi:hypothetical protein
MPKNNLRQVTACGVSPDDAAALRRISMTLHRWHELECGDGRGFIERDEVSGKPRYVSANDPRAWRIIPDREGGALKRLGVIMGRYPTLRAFVQGDPRGCALYLLRPNDVPDGADVSSYYSRGIPVF